MCGIAGIIKASGIDSRQLISMSESLRHRGPDDEGFFIIDKGKSSFLTGNDSVYKQHEHISQLKNPEISLGFVHRRLSILDLTVAGHQPMKLPDFEGVMTYNGEVYNYRELREELKTFGYTFSSDSDSEVILRAFAHWGKECVKKFKGMWAFAIFLPTSNTVFFSRDRFGIKPLCYFLKNETLVFASEIKAITVSGEYTPELEQKALYEYLVYGSLNEKKRTLFNNVFELPAAHNMVYDITAASLSFEKYYDLEKTVSEKLNTREQFTGEGYLSTLEQSINIHLRSDVPVGSCLSGGLDSSLLVAHAAQLTGSRFHTFTATFKEKEIDESYFAKQVIAGFSNITPHFTEPSSQQYWQDIEKLIWHQDQPIASTSMYSQWEVMKLAGANGTKVLLDGQGADETLGGYANFSGVFLLNLLLKAKFSLFFAEKNKLKEQRTLNPLREMGRAFFYKLPGKLKQVARNKNRIGNNLLNESFKNNFSGITFPLYKAATFRDASVSAVNSGLQSLLRYEDRNSMAFSIESRVPFLEHETVEYAICLNDTEKIKNGWTKYPLREYLHKQNLPEIAWRKDKKGFITPQAKWKQELKPQLLAYIHDYPLPAFVNKTQLLQYVNSDMNNSNSLSEFWKMIAVMKWMQIFKLSV